MTRPGDINFEFTVKTCLEPDDVDRLRKAGSLEARLDVLHEIFGEDLNIWEAFYVSALDAYDRVSE